MSTIDSLLQDFSSEVATKAFVEKQHKTISDLMIKTRELQDKVNHLEQLLMDAGIENTVQKVIITPEEYLLDAQIDLITERSMGRELELEDVKKLDILLKNKKIIADDKKTLEVPKAAPKKKLSTQELILIASKKEPSNG